MKQAQALGVTVKARSLVFCYQYSACNLEALKILQTIFARSASVKAFRGGGGGGTLPKEYSPPQKPALGSVLVTATEYVSRRLSTDRSDRLQPRNRSI